MHAIHRTDGGLKKAPAPALQVRGPVDTVATQLGLSLTGNAHIKAHLDEVRTLVVGQGGRALLQHGVDTGFESLPVQHQGLAQQTARILGIGPVQRATTGPMSFEQLAESLQSAVEAAARLQQASSARAQTPLRRTEALRSSAERIRSATDIAAQGLRQMPTEALLIHREAVKELLGDLVDVTEAAYEKLKAQLGDTHEVTVAALQARTEAAQVSFDTYGRMAWQRGKNALYGIAGGPIVSGLTRLLGRNGS